MRQADYVIVGAGSAGCAVAGRLSEDPSVSVLLIEAGGSSRHMSVAIPAAFAQQFHTKRDWDLATEPEPGCDMRSLFVPRGKGLGGSSSMNAMLYVRGRPLDYDIWEREGATGWGWKDVKPTSCAPRTTRVGRQMTMRSAARFASRTPAHRVP